MGKNSTSLIKIPTLSEYNKRIKEVNTFQLLKSSSYLFLYSIFLNKVNTAINPLNSNLIIDVVFKDVIVNNNLIHNKIYVDLLMSHDISNWIILSEMLYNELKICLN